MLLQCKCHLILPLLPSPLDRGIGHDGSNFDHRLLEVLRVDSAKFIRFQDAFWIQSCVPWESHGTMAHHSLNKKKPKIQLWIPDNPGKMSYSRRKTLGKNGKTWYQGPASKLNMLNEYCTGLTAWYSDKLISIDACEERTWDALRILLTLLLWLLKN